MTMRSKPSEKTFELLLEYEVGGGKEFYEKKLSKFTWPGGSSGPTIGIGIDTAYYTPAEIASIFNFLPVEQVKLIQKAPGQFGPLGKRYTAELRKAGITVTWDQAVEIFNTLTWPKFSRAAEIAFPDLDKFLDDAYGAIVSLVFNRGTSMKGETRKEMRMIRALVPEQNYKQIAFQIRSMKRLWEGKDLDGLIKRREAEAQLIESVI